MTIQGLSSLAPILDARSASQVIKQHVAVESLTRSLLSICSDMSQKSFFIRPATIDDVVRDIFFSCAPKHVSSLIVHQDAILKLIIGLVRVSQPRELLPTKLTLSRPRQPMRRLQTK